jgi:hypothetical protein
VTFVNVPLAILRGRPPARPGHYPEYYVVPSRIVAERMKVNPNRKGSVFYAFHKRTSPECEGNWKAFDGDTIDEGA